MKFLISKWLVVSILFIFYTQSLPAQDSPKLYEKALKALYDEDFETASRYLQQIEDTGKSYKDSKYRLEICLLVQKKHRERPLDIFLKFRETKEMSDKFFYYWMGRIFANRYMFPEAVTAWKHFLSRKGFKSEEILAETKNFIAETEKLISYFDNATNYEIHQLEAPINSKHAELSPIYHKERDKLFFSSNRNNPSNDLFSIYETKSTDSGWDPIQRVSNFREMKRPQSAIEMINKDGKMFLFGNPDKAQLNYAEFDGTTWSAPLKFDADFPNLEADFYINEHEDRILFVSYDKRNGLNIFESFRNVQSGQWEKPHPLPPSINSEYNEDSPFLSEDESKLYFSSDRPNGVGGYDVYVSELDPTTQKWSDPTNLGWPINSPDDDVQFKLNSKENSGYFTSNRIHSKGDFDIFFFWKIEKNKIQGRVINAKTKEPITSGEIRFHPSQYLDEYFRSTLDPNGKYETEIIANESFLVRIIDQYDTLLSEQFSVPRSKRENLRHIKDFYVYSSDLSEEEKAILKSQYLEPKKEKTPEKKVVTETSKSPTKEPEKTKPKTPLNISAKSHVLQNIYFEDRTSKLTQGSEPVLNELLNYLNNNPNLKIEISGHTDNVGYKDRNLTLSKKRAEAAKTWLVLRGIPPDRIQTIGYGDTKPIASNDDETNGRELNRRIEIRKME